MIGHWAESRSSRPDGRHPQFSRAELARQSKVNCVQIVGIEAVRNTGSVFCSDEDGGGTRRWIRRHRDESPHRVARPRMPILCGEGGHGKVRMFRPEVTWQLLALITQAAAGFEATTPDNGGWPSQEMAAERLQALAARTRPVVTRNGETGRMQTTKHKPKNEPNCRQRDANVPATLIRACIFCESSASWLNVRLRSES